MSLGNGGLIPGDEISPGCVLRSVDFPSQRVLVEYATEPGYPGEFEAYDIAFLNDEKANTQLDVAFLAQVYALAAPDALRRALLKGQGYGKVTKATAARIGAQARAAASYAMAEGRLAA